MVEYDQYKLSLNALKAYIEELGKALHIDNVIAQAEEM